MWLTIVGVVLVLVCAWVYSKRAPKIPGVALAPGYVPFFGHIFAINGLVGKRAFLDYNLKAALDNPAKPFQLCIPDKPPILRITTPEAVQHILKDKFENYIKIDTPITKMIGVELFGEGIFAVDGEKWRYERKVASYMFATNVLNRTMERTFLDHGEVLVRVLTDACKSKQTIDMQDLMKRYTMDSIAKIGFGVDFRSLEKPKDEFSIAFDRIQELIIRRAFKPVLLMRLDVMFQTGFEKEFTRCAEVLDGLVEDIIRKRKESASEISEHADESWQDLLSHFMDFSKKKNESFDIKQARDVVMNFLIAGRDTTACLLTWTFYELARHPEMEKRIVEEIKEMLANNPLSHQSVKDLKFTHNFLSEVLRLHPPVPFDSKRAMNEDVLPDGTPVPVGTIVHYSPYLFGHAPWNWENPEELIPERWDKDPNPTDFKFLTFNAGPRLCLGKRMAFLEAKMVLSMVLPEFHVSIVPNQSDELNAFIILWLRDGLQAKIIPRAEWSA